MEAYLEITTLGCRNLIPYNFLPITLPRLEFVLETPDDTLSSKSPESKKPSPQNPNFLRYDVRSSLPLSLAHASSSLHVAGVESGQVPREEYLCASACDQSI